MCACSAFELGGVVVHMAYVPLLLLSAASPCKHTQQQNPAVHPNDASGLMSCGCLQDN
jgi:hypothetical protein